MMIKVIVVTKSFKNNLTLKARFLVYNTFSLKWVSHNVKFVLSSILNVLFAFLKDFLVKKIKFFKVIVII